MKQVTAVLTILNAVKKTNFHEGLDLFTMKKSSASTFLLKVFLDVK